MAKRHVTLGVLILLALIVPILGIAQERGNQRPFRGGRFGNSPLGRLIRGNIGRRMSLKADLNLTDEQWSKLKGILEKHRKDFQPVAKKIVERKRTLREVVLSKTADETAIRKAAKNLGTAIGDAAVLASKIADEARTVLTPEQIERISQFSQERDNAIDRWLEEVAD